MNFTVTLDHAVQGGFDVASANDGSGTAADSDYTLTTTTLTVRGHGGRDADVP